MDTEMNEEERRLVSEGLHVSATRVFRKRTGGTISQAIKALNGAISQAIKALKETPEYRRAVASPREQQLSQQCSDLLDRLSLLEARMAGSENRITALEDRHQKLGAYHQH